jgi:magnesium transporter
VVAFRLLPRDLAADVFEYLSLDAQERLLKAMATEEVAKVLNDMAPDDRTALLDELPASVTQQLLNLLTPQERSIAVSLLGYPEGSIGRIMTPDYVRVRPDWTIDHALDHIRRYGHDSETLSVVYVINDDGRLIGEVPIRKILLSPLTGHLADIIDRRVVALKAIEPRKRRCPCSRPRIVSPCPSPTPGAC